MSSLSVYMKENDTVARPSLPWFGRLYQTSKAMSAVPFALMWFVAADEENLK